MNLAVKNRIFFEKQYAIIQKNTIEQVLAQVLFANW
jgi:hypothetical protein